MFACDLLQRLHLRPNVGRLYDGPATGPVDLINAKLLLAISVANTGVDVVVVEERALLGIPVNALTAGAINPSVRLKDSGTTTLSAFLAGLIDEAARGALRSADLNLVFLALGGAVGIESTALANREEQVVVIAVLCNERSFLGMLSFRFKCDVGGRAAGGFQRGIVEVHYEQVLPERSERHDKLGTIPVKGAIDGVIVLASLRGDTGTAVVGPGANGEGLGGGYTDSGVLNTEGRNSVV